MRFLQPCPGRGKPAPSALLARVSILARGLCLVFPLLLAPAAAAAPVELAPAFAKAASGRHPVSIVIDMGGGLKLPAQVDSTTQGNGTLSVANLTLRLLDRHDDGIVYGGNGILHVDAAPLGTSGQAASVYCLIIYGTVVHTGEKEADPPIQEVIVFIYQLDAKSGRLERTFKSSSIDIELGALAPTRSREKQDELRKRQSPAAGAEAR